MPEASTPRVCFVIPHKGREALLRATLISVAQQQPAGKGATECGGETDGGRQGAAGIAVVLVTQNPQLEADTERLLEGLAVPVEVLYRPATDTISALRNAGAAHSRAPWLAFLDADVELSPDWLRQLLPRLESEEHVALVSAMQRNSAAAPPLERIRTALSNAVLDAPVSFLPGRNLLLARSTFEAVGGFPEHLVTCEDYYFTDKVGEHGTLLYSSAASYVHLGEDRDYAQMARKEVWRGQSNLQSLRGRRIRLGEWPSFLVPPWVTLLPLLALALLLAGYPVVAATALLAALLPLAAYVMRLYLLAQRRIAIGSILRFYLYYFPARTWGTVRGLVSAVGAPGDGG